MYENNRPHPCIPVFHPQCPPEALIPTAQCDPYYERALALIRERTEADLYKATRKRELTLDMEEQLLKIKEDVRIEAGCLSESFSLSENGTVERKQEFLLRKPQTFKAANFRVLDAQGFCKSHGENPAVLFLLLQLENGQERCVCLDLTRSKPNYIARKLREAGAALKLKRGEKNEVYLDFITLIANAAHTCIIPQHHGFYRVDDRLCYAGKDDMTLQEVANYVG